MKDIKLDIKRIDKMIKTLENIKIFAEKLEEYKKFLEENRWLITEAEKLNLLVEEEEVDTVIVEAPVKKIIPKTNPSAEIHIYHNGDLVLEWWKAGRRTDSVKILDEHAFYRKMKALADEEGKLTYTDFWKAIKHINGMNSNKATMIFNYYGLNPAFNTRIERIQEEMGFMSYREWCIIFENGETVEEYDYTPPDPETMRQYWKDLLG